MEARSRDGDGDQLRSLGVYLTLEERHKQRGAMNEKLTVFGYGSLVNIQSLKDSCPTASNIHVARLRGYTRIFNLTSVGRLVREKLSPTSRRLAALSIRKLQSSSQPLIGVVFDIQQEDWISFEQREHRYLFADVEVEIICPLSDSPPQHLEAFLHQPEGTFEKRIAVTCLENDDITYRTKCGEEEWNQRVGQHYGSSPLWNRNDILPSCSYLFFARRAFFTLGVQYHSHFIDSSVLVDGVTTIRSYLLQFPHHAIYNGTWDLSSLAFTDSILESSISPLLITNNNTVSIYQHNDENIQEIAISSFNDKTELQNVNVFWLNDNEIQEVPRFIFETTIGSHIQVLHLQNNQIRSLPKEMFQVGGLSSLLSLRLDNNYIQEIPSSIGNVSTLQELNVADNEISVLPMEIEFLSNLRELNIANNPISLILPQTLLSSPFLNIISQ